MACIAGRDSETYSRERAICLLQLPASTQVPLHLSSSNLLLRLMVLLLKVGLPLSLGKMLTLNLLESENALN